MKLKLSALLWGMLIWCMYSKAQSLKDLMELALAENYGILLQKNNAEIAENENTRGNAGQLPTVNLEGRHQQNVNTAQQVFFTGEERAGKNAQSNLLSGQVSLNWDIFDGFKMFAEKKRLDFLEQKGALEAQFNIDQTLSDLAILYHQLIFEAEQLQMIQEIIAISQYRLNLEEKRRSVGSGNILAYQQALVDYQNDEVTLWQQKFKIKAIQIQLNNLLNLEGDNAIQTESTTVPFTLPSEQDLIQKVQKRNFLYQSAQLQSLIADKEVVLAKALRYPTIGVFAGYSYSNNRNEIGFIQQSLNYGNNIGITVRMNLYNGGRNNLAIKNSKIQQQNAELDKKQIQQNLKNEALELYYQLLNVEQQLELADKNVHTASKMQATAEQQFKLAAINGYELRLSQLSMLQTQQNKNYLALQKAVLAIHLLRLTGNVQTFLVN